MSNLNFPKDGPVIVTGEDFGIFQRSNYSSFDQMFYAWLDENNRNGVRRLIIRDLLRQSHGKNDPMHTYYDTSHGFGRLMHVGGGNKAKELFWTLHNRPKLLDEITSELLYNLKHDYMSIESIGKDSLTHLLELLLTVTKETEARSLWEYHPVQSHINMPLSERMGEFLRLYTGRTNLPQFLRNELWQKIKQDLTAAINAQRIPLEKSGIPCITDNATMKTIVTFVEFMTNESFHDDSRSVATVSECVGLLEDILPHGVTYFDRINLERIAPRLNDKLLTCKMLQRHINAYDEKDLERGKANFLYWTRGVISACDPNADACIKKIDLSIANNVEYEIVFE